jgi:hypothetical protein
VTGLGTVTTSLLEVDTADVLTPNEQQADNSLLARLLAWLPYPLAAIVQALAIPIRLIALLWRALLSAGSGMALPAALLAGVLVTMYGERGSSSVHKLRREIRLFNARIAQGIR